MLTILSFIKLSHLYLNELIKLQVIALGRRQTCNAMQVKPAKENSSIAGHGHREAAEGEKWEGVGGAATVRWKQQLELKLRTT